MVITSKLPPSWIILFQGIVAVRTGRNDLFDAIAVHGVDIHLGKCLIEILITAPHGRIAAAALFRTEDAEADARRLEDLGKGHGDLLPRSSNDPAQPT